MNGGQSGDMVEMTPMSVNNCTKKNTQLKFNLIHPSEVIQYRQPDTQAEPLAGLLRVLTTSHANGWRHLAALAHERIKANCGVDDD